MTNQPTKTKTHQHAPIEHMELALLDLKLTPAKLARELGYADSVIHNWRSQGRMPLVAAKLCDRLVAQSKATTPATANSTTTCLISIIRGMDKLEVAERLLNSLDIKTFTIPLNGAKP